VEWARAVNPDQPISDCLGLGFTEKLNAFQIASSTITYHDYEEPQWHQRVIKVLKMSGRPLICTSIWPAPQQPLCQHSSLTEKNKKT